MDSTSCDKIMHRNGETGFARREGRLYEMWRERPTWTLAIPVEVVDLCTWHVEPDCLFASLPLWLN